MCFSFLFKRTKLIVFWYVIRLSSQGIFQNSLYEVICSKVYGCFLDLAFVFKLHFTDSNRTPVAGFYPAILKRKDNLCARFRIIRELFLKFFKGGYDLSLSVSDETILRLNGEVSCRFPVIRLVKLEARIKTTYLVQIEVMLFNPFVIKKVKGVTDIGMYNGCNGANNLIPSRSA